MEKIYDNLDFMRGVEVFLNLMPGASMFALRQGFRDGGLVGGTIGISETLTDSKSLLSKHGDHLSMPRPISI